jgi:hypothetical protein
MLARAAASLVAPVPTASPVAAPGFSRAPGCQRWLNGDQLTCNRVQSTICRHEAVLTGPDYSGGVND